MHYIHFLCLQRDLEECDLAFQQKLQTTLEPSLPAMTEVIGQFDDNRDWGATINQVHIRTRYAELTGMMRDEIFLIQLADAGEGRRWDRGYSFEMPASNSCITFKINQGCIELIQTEGEKRNLATLLKNAQSVFDHPAMIKEKFSPKYDGCVFAKYFVPLGPSHGGAGF